MKSRSTHGRPTVLNAQHTTDRPCGFREPASGRLTQAETIALAMLAEHRRGPREALPITLRRFSWEEGQ